MTDPPTAWWGGSGEHSPVVEEALRLGASQDAEELRLALEMVQGCEPQVILEIGCDRGGTLYAWRQVCERVYGITTKDNSYESGGSGLPLETHGAVVHIGDSHERTATAWLAGQLGHGYDPTDLLDPVDVLVLDGDHTVWGVRQDLAMYGPLVRPGGLIL